MNIVFVNEADDHRSFLRLSLAPGLGPEVHRRPVAQPRDRENHSLPHQCQSCLILQQGPGPPRCLHLGHSGLLHRHWYSFSYSLALTDFGAQTLDFAASPDIALHIEVLNERLVAGTTFHFDIDFASDVVNIPNRAEVTHVSLSYIIIGEFFSGVTDTSFLFARNGEMNGFSNAAGALYDFQNDALNLDSPFLWDATTDGTACGAVVVDG